MKCKHIQPSAPVSIMLWSGHTMEFLVCCRCAAALSLGPSSDTPEVQIEIRAAELASEWTRERGTSDRATLNEDMGWLKRSARGVADQTPVTDSAHAGWLAHAIVHHDEEQARAEVDQARDEMRTTHNALCNQVGAGELKIEPRVHIAGTEGP